MTNLSKDQKQVKSQQNQQNNDEDPFFGLKYIAYCRSHLPDLDDFGESELIDFAKWQICKVKSVLFNDPIWENYTKEEILVEYFAIRFDESKELLEEFKSKLVHADKEVYDLFERLERTFAPATKKEKDNQEPEEFEDSYE